MNTHIDLMKFGHDGFSNNLWPCAHVYKHCCAHACLCLFVCACTHGCVCVCVCACVYVSGRVCTRARKKYSAKHNVRVRALLVCVLHTGVDAT